jgi:hypothetical protein
MAEQVKEKEDRLTQEEELYNGIEPYISKDSEFMISTVIVLVAVVILAFSIISSLDIF